MPALLTMGEPISDSASTSGIMYLRREGKIRGTTGDIMLEKQLYTLHLYNTLRSVTKEGKEVLRVPEQRFPCSPEGSHTGTGRCAQRVL